MSEVIEFGEIDELLALVVVQIEFPELLVVEERDI